MTSAYGERVETIVAALEAQQAELTSLLGDDAWSRPSRCAGWSVADVVLHLAQTNEMAQASIDGTFGEWAKGFPSDARDVDDGAARLVARERGGPVDELRRRWLDGAARMCASFRAIDASARVPWVAGTMAARTLATTRLAETWIHTNDIAPVPPTGRLEHIARLAWRTIPHAFGRAGLPAPGPTAFRLSAPGGGTWRFEPDVAPVNVIEGDGVELCAVASRRVPPTDTSLRPSGPDAAKVLELVRTWA
jgi:uncharacterized protein (TIGR03084 family)